MPQLTHRQASLFAAIAFLTTIAVNAWIPGYTITLSGLLVVIFLSVFVPARSSTIIAGCVSTAVVCGFLALQISRTGSANFIQFIFIALLVLLTTLLVLYIKSLIRDMQFDKSHMSSLFENATEGIIVTNSRAEIILVNPEACRMFGYEAEELMGKPVETLLPQKYRAGHVHLRNNFYHKPSNRRMGSGRDLNGARKDGSNFPVEVSLSSYKQQESQYVIAFIVDITHRKEIEESMLQQQEQLEKISNDVRKLNAGLEIKVEERTQVLKEALQRLEQSQIDLSAALDKERQLNEIKGRFVSMASHEFRTPLSAVLSSASLIAKYTETSQQPNRDKHINRIRDSVKHLNDLLEDFLSLGKLDEGKIGAQLEPFNLAETIADTLDDVRGLLRPGQELVSIHEGPVNVVNDKRLLRNVLINLITNAIKFSEEGSKIRIESKVDKARAELSVIDAGIGISEEDQQHLFSTFFRGSNALNIQGTGLGLHIVKRYADLMGGDILVKSKLGAGTTITLWIPVNN